MIYLVILCNRAAGAGIRKQFYVDPRQSNKIDSIVEFRRVVEL